MSCISNSSDTCTIIGCEVYCIHSPIQTHTIISIVPSKFTLGDHSLVTKPQVQLHLSVFGAIVGIQVSSGVCSHLELGYVNQPFDWLFNEAWEHRCPVMPKRFGKFQFIAHSHTITKSLLLSYRSLMMI